MLLQEICKPAKIFWNFYNSPQVQYTTHNLHEKLEECKYPSLKFWLKTITSYNIFTCRMTTAFTMQIIMLHITRIRNRHLLQKLYQSFYPSQGLNLTAEAGILSMVCWLLPFLYTSSSLVYLLRCKWWKSKQVFNAISTYRGEEILHWNVLQGTF